MSEVRPIDANALKKYLSEFNYDMALRIVDIQPTIEAEPVRHGRWKKKNGEIYCTNCKKSKWSESFELMLRGFDFCPKCGARMDGGAENGDDA